MIAAELDGAARLPGGAGPRPPHRQRAAFLIGVRVLTGTIAAAQAGGAYALLAECMIAAMQAEVEREMARGTAACRAAALPSSPWASSAGAK